MVSTKPSQRKRIERVNGHSSPVAAQNPRHGRLKRARSFPVLDFDDQRLSSVDEIENVFKEGNWLGAAREPQLGDFRGIGQFHARIQAGQSMQVPVVKDHGTAVRAGLNVDFDGKALLNGCLYRAKRIFRTGLVMESAMSDRGGNEPGWCRHCESLLHRLPGLVAGELFDSSGVPASFESGVEPDIDDSQGDLDRDHALSERKDVGVIVLAGEFGRFVIPTESAPNALDLVGGDSLAVAGSAENDAQLRFTSDDRLGSRNDPQWIVGRFSAVRAEIDDFVSLFLEMFDDPLLVAESSVVGANGDFHTG